MSTPNGVYRIGDALGTAPTLFYQGFTGALAYRNGQLFFVDQSSPNKIGACSTSQTTCATPTWLFTETTTSYSIVALAADDAARLLGRARRRANHEGVAVSVAPGTLLAKKYRTERVIGEGGMGIVVAARHVELGRRVAIKLVRKDAVAAGSVERLLREARAAASVDNEHVARVLDVGRTKKGEPYLVMEYLEGQDLHARLASGPPARAADAVSWILQACEGLAAAHARGIVHRDLKPGNLFLARLPDGREVVKLLDFGLAKSVEMDDGRITATGAISGLAFVHVARAPLGPHARRAQRRVVARSDALRAAHARDALPRQHDAGDLRGGALVERGSPRLAPT